MAALATVGDYLVQARSLLQDMVSPYRYPDSDLIDALNLGFLEIARLRPDIIQNTTYTQQVSRRFEKNILTPPSYTDKAAAVDLAPAYRVALLYYICGNAQARDLEEVQDTRASLFLGKFAQQLLVLSP